MEDDKQIEEQNQQPITPADEPQAAAPTDGQPAPETVPLEDTRTPGEEVAAMKALTDEYLAGWQRAKADYANLQKEMDRLRQDHAKYGSAGLIKTLMPVIDSFRKAAASRPRFDDG